MAKKRYQITVLLNQEERVQFYAYCDELGFKRARWWRA